MNMHDGWMDGCLTTSLASNGHIEVLMNMHELGTAGNVYEITLYER